MIKNHRLDALKSGLRSARSKRDVRGPGRSGGPVWGPAARVAIDFVAALAVGVALGLAVDAWLGTQPWGLIVFFILGSAAGMMNVYRIARGHDMAVGYRHQTGDSQNNKENSKENNKENTEKKDQDVSG